MKKILLTAALLTLLFTLTKPVYADNVCTCGSPFCVYNTTTEAQARKKVKAYVNRYYRKGRYKNFRVEFISFKRLTTKKLTTRKQNKVIYVEILDGFVMDDDTYSGITSDGYYISYDGVDDSLPKGSKIRTYTVYSPKSNYEDDIVYRTDRVINQERNRKEIKVAKKKFKKNFGYDY